MGNVWRETLLKYIAHNHNDENGRNKTLYETMGNCEEVPDERYYLVT